MNSSEVQMLKNEILNNKASINKLYDSIDGNNGKGLKERIVVVETNQRMHTRMLYSLLTIGGATLLTGIGKLLLDFMKQ